MSTQADLHSNSTAAGSTGITLRHWNQYLLRHHPLIKAFPASTAIHLAGRLRAGALTSAVIDPDIGVLIESRRYICPVRCARACPFPEP